MAFWRRSTVGEDVWLVVGLGNPGPKYEATRHNAGVMVVDLLAGRVGGRFKAHRSRCDVVEGRLSGVRAVLAKPRSYMNESGGPVKALRDFYKVPDERVLVVHDELDIDFGSVRLKRGGGDNGHNGLRSVTRSLGSKEYLRLRFGVGRPPGRMDAAAFVLKEFSVAERRELPYFLDRAGDAAEAVLTSGLEAAQNTYHAP
ncbi:aminoacyl-tRNA hydrolase [Actinocorallia sp. API 0066]|uniref:aminoacyl-tRNA hydrolase n=1 Tax=Actinocorallia sp. API 0066 TaxID=2896846 RepID=UPI001E5107A1|nr:aminoacyl-tRNA hydrolase [Actinocorallia sp. API 0066]MCD0447800.1 aminoacyl-tRNA hydrolase [Actinocorallia sp. API 0066]